MKKLSEWMNEVCPHVNHGYHRMVCENCLQERIDKERAEQGRLYEVALMKAFGMPALVFAFDSTLLGGMEKVRDAVLMEIRRLLAERRNGEHGEGVMS